MSIVNTFLTVPQCTFLVFESFKLSIDFENRDYSNIPKAQCLNALRKFSQSFLDLKWDYIF